MRPASSSATATASLLARTIHLKLAPQLAPLAIRRAILRLIRTRFGAVASFQSLRYSSSAQDAFVAVLGSSSAAAAAEAAAQRAVQESPLEVELRNEATGTTSKYTVTISPSRRDLRRAIETAPLYGSYGRVRTERSAVSAALLGAGLAKGGVEAVARAGFVDWSVDRPRRGYDEEETTTNIPWRLTAKRDGGKGNGA
jgi:hypothetical protein